MKLCKITCGRILKPFSDSNPVSETPLSAQIALWDMIYNLGPTGLAQFRMLRQAILDGDWEEAAEQSYRNGPSEVRNQYVFGLFMDAAEEP